ncbi:MAG: polyphosphate kinase 1 [Methanobacteriaceae archaeon]|nr:polyphosphate kinase 1 [Methanobacteriaceae archaeon]MDP2835461.1 polyphosphate kinase 1 [Methanobacteriaceae archaeon]MDP3034767.1 polyphosphate kinase 1 [Methanobacteriaceae archaeon]MDP3484645.1 polyphosphate kinase 1 [Methanobacteriaceae archaeon]MDP3622565.1 polyphosphate kinase 1 [Methanobacteriaceae archaeon]
MSKDDYSFTQNRELSWLRFNDRVLEEAEDGSVPLLERLKYVSIFTSNLDEFYMVRCGSLYDLSLINEDYIDNKTGLNAQDQLDAIFDRTKFLNKRRDNVFKSVHSLLKEQGIQDLDFNDLTKSETKFINKYFFNYIFPVLSPQIIDIHHPFPHLLNKSLNVMLIINDKSKILYGLIPIPSSLTRVIYFPNDEMRFILLEKVIYEYVNEIFSNYNVEFKTVVSVTRNADIALSNSQIDEDEDYRGYMKKILKKRTRLAPIRLEFYKYSDPLLTKFLCDQLNIEKNQLQISNSPLDMSYVFNLYEHVEKKNELVFHKLSFNPYYPKIPKAVKEGKIISQLKKNDILLFYPYESIEPFLSLLKEAANDENVISIQITIYRLARSSSVIKYLLEACENGKDVTVLIELRARFDEERNIHYAGLLEEAGCRVLYGFKEYKVHSKVCLITRKERNRIQYITQLGTGNYNEKTCKLYTDLSFITINRAIGEDAMLFFKNMAISNLNGEYKKLFVAPFGLKPKLIEKINGEIELANNNRPASIILKMNSLTDIELIEMLSKASCAGVKIKLIVRGICCLVPSLAGKTENIEVISIVGRFLEHARIYCFGTGEDVSIYLSSGDLMTRNTEKRVEIAFPIENPILQEKIIHILNIMLNDNVKARKINDRGEYEKVIRSIDLIDSQNYFMDDDFSVNEEEEIETESFFSKLKHLFRNNN